MRGEEGTFGTKDLEKFTVCRCVEGVGEGDGEGMKSSVVLMTGSLFFSGVRVGVPLRNSRRAVPVVALEDGRVKMDPASSCDMLSCRDCDLSSTVFHHSKGLLRPVRVDSLSASSPNCLIPNLEPVRDRC